LIFFLIKKKPQGLGGLWVKLTTQPFSAASTLPKLSIHVLLHMHRDHFFRIMTPMIQCHMLLSVYNYFQKFV
jgi:hypothetical protein